LVYESKPFLENFVKNLSQYGTLLSAILVVAGAISARFGKFILDQIASESHHPRLPAPEAQDQVAAGESFLISPNAVARAHVIRRLSDATNAREQQKGSAKVSKWTANLLTFAQVVIGGVLASSFVQESLSPKAVGVFGVLVLIASLVKQQYRPEVDAEEARQKASRLQALIRSSEDELATLDAKSTKGEDRTDALIALANRISGGLTDIENPEAAQSKLSKPPVESEGPSAGVRSSGISRPFELPQDPHNKSDLSKSSPTRQDSGTATLDGESESEPDHALTIPLPDGFSLTWRRFEFQGKRGLTVAFNNERLEAIAQLFVTVFDAQSYDERQGAFRNASDFSAVRIDFLSIVQPSCSANPIWFVRKEPDKPHLFAGNDFGHQMKWPENDRSETQKWRMSLGITAKTHARSSSESAIVLPARKIPVYVQWAKAANQFSITWELRN
jgi:hypothetical protein